MFARILVVVDNSDVMQSVVDYVAALFPKSFFYLYSAINLGQFAGYYTKVVYKEMSELSGQTLSNLGTSLEQRSIKFSTKMEVGEPVSNILSFARLNKIDLIVLETHAGVSANKIKLGTTTASLIMHSHVPLLLLGEDLGATEKPVILHPTSGSKYSELATEVAAKLASEWSSRLNVLILNEDVERIKKRIGEIIVPYNLNANFSSAESGKEVASVIAQAANADIIVGSRGSPRKSYKLRFLFRPFALDPHVKLLVAFLPKPFLLVCD
ncbi:MAG: universal stress protein [Caldisericaceae bacterium]